MARGESYEKFVEKYKPKKTTDDCYTPPKVYQAVLDWVVEEYGVDRDKVVRPFYLGGDYEHFDYSNGAVVVDNPPFSILQKIKNFYVEREIPFFLFAPALTLMGGKDPEVVSYVMVGETIVYENGAKISTGFVTNLDQYRLRLSQSLKQRIKEAQAEAQTTFPKYAYPPNVLNGALAGKYLNAGVALVVSVNECTVVRQLDAQAPYGKEIFGRGMLLSEGKTKELQTKFRQREEKVPDHVWELSEREKAIIAELE